MIKKGLLILLSITTLSPCVLIVQSCGPFYNCGPGVQLKVKAINGTAKRITGTTTSPAVPVPFFTVSAYNHNESISFDSVGLDIFNDLSASIRHNETLFNAAFACSPREDYEVIRGFTIVSDEKYNDNLPAGTNLKDVMSYHPSHTTEGFSIDEGVIDQTAQHGSLFLKFASPPDEERLHNFTITYTMEGGAQFTTRINAVLIAK